MVPTGHTRPWSRLNGSKPIGGTAAAPTYMDDEVKALDPTRCGPVFQTVMFDPITQATTTLWHQSHYLQVWTGALSTFGVDAIVLEPLSAMSDAFNNHNGLHVLDAGEFYSNEFGITIG